MLLEMQFNSIQFNYSGETGGVIEGSGSTTGGGPSEGKSSKLIYEYCEVRKQLMLSSHILNRDIHIHLCRR